MLIHPLPDPVALHLGPLAVRWYGVMYMLAFIQFMLLGRVRARQPHMAALGWRGTLVDDMLFFGILGVVIGGRLGEVFFYNPAYYLTHPLKILAVWEGGMSFHGGFLGVLLGMWYWSRRNGRRLMDVMDFIAPLVPLGYAFGRLGNFINGELPGRLCSSVAWCMYWPNVDALPRHPSPIYQMLVDGILLFAILWIYARRARPCMAVAGMFSLLYGGARCFTEHFRIPDYEVSLAGVSLSAGQLLSLPMIALGVILLIVAYSHRQYAQPPAALSATAPD